MDDGRWLVLGACFRCGECAAMEEMEGSAYPMLPVFLKMRAFRPGPLVQGASMDLAADFRWPRSAFSVNLLLAA